MLRLGSQWKTRLGGLADQTVSLAHESKAAERASVMGHMFKAGLQADAGNDKWKMIPVTMNAGGMLAVSPFVSLLLLSLRVTGVGRGLMMCIGGVGSADVLARDAEAS